jgi:CubicO group peptidase (beta-lactamase class C family)
MRLLALVATAFTMLSPGSGAAQDAIAAGAIPARAIAAGANAADAIAADATPTRAIPAHDARSVRVDEIFRQWHTPESPGAAVLVLENGSIVHAKGYGMANLDHGIPIRTTTVFDIASVSKQFGAMAIALLEAEGSIALDDDVRRYIPELPDFGHTITIRHLVHHTSGIRDWPGTLRLAGWDYQDVISFEHILRMARHQHDLNFVPGSAYAYSNTGYNLLAEVVQRVSGMTFREFTAGRIFRPLGMHATHFSDDHTSVVRNRADSYRRNTDGGYHRVGNSLTALGSSSLFTTVEDLARWTLNFDEPVVGGAHVAARMHERGVLNDGTVIPYAFGHNIGDYRGLQAVTHTGSWAGFRTVLQRFPDERFAVIILANSADINPSVLASQVADIYLEGRLAPVQAAAASRADGARTEAARTEAARAAAAAAAPGGPVTGEPRWFPTDAELLEYAGTYMSRELLTGWSVEVREGQLVASHFRVGDAVFRPLRRDTFQAAAFGEVRFERGADGRLVAFTANSDRVRGLRFHRVD